MLETILMKCIELNSFEKIYIYFCCCEDIKNGRFSGRKSENLVRDKDFDAKDTEDSSLDDGCASKAIDKISDRGKVVSPFVIKELSYLIAKRNKLIAKKWCIYKDKDNSNKMNYRMRKFPDVIAEIDDIIRKLEGNIRCIDEEYAASIAELQEKYNRNIAGEDYHLAKANVRAAHAKREQFRSNKQAIYERLLFLLSEEIRLINIINARINVIKEWRFLRIRYYYGWACKKGKNLPIFVYSEEDFSEICGEPLGGDYTGKLIDTENKYNQIMNEISFSNEMNIKEAEYPPDNDN